MHFETVHPDKRFIGKTEKGFDFLGYRFKPGQLLRPAMPSIYRLLEYARWLHERGADIHRLQQYVQRWFGWLHGGLHGRVSFKVRRVHYWQFVLKQLHLLS